MTRQYSSKTTQTMHTCRSSNDLLINMRGCSRGRSTDPPSAKKMFLKAQFYVFGLYCGQSKLPLNEAEHGELFEAGLGEKTIEFENMNCSANNNNVTPFILPSHNYIPVEATSF